MTMRFPNLAAALVAIGLAGVAGAHEFRIDALTIGHPYAIATAASARTGAGYLTISNQGSEPDRLIAVEAAFPMVRVHSTTTDAAGVARMSEVEAVEIPPGGTVALEPGGMHVMFMGLAGPLVEGEKIDATLVFETAGAVEVQFNVEPRGAAAEAGGHADH
jgi:copper(I)-binding protein